MPRAEQKDMGGKRIALIALGSNLPFGALSGAALLDAAVAALEAEGLAVLSRSQVWTTPAWPPSDQPDYANAVVAADAGALTPDETLALLMATERRFGRERRELWAARTLDLDLLDLDGAVLDTETLTLPHPRLHERRFVLGPLAEAAPDWRHPVFGHSAMELLAALDREPAV